MSDNPLDSLAPPGANPLDSLAPPAPTAAPVAQPSPSYSFSDFVKDYGSAAIRPVVKAVTGLPLMAMDAGVAARNLVTGNIDTSSLKSLLFGSQKAAQEGATESPSATFNQYLDSATRAPTTTVGKIAEFGNTVLAGAGLPGPAEIGGGAYKAPDQFGQATNLLRNNILQKSQDEGYVVPPSTNNPTFMNRLLEGISGKQKIAMEASVRNQAVTDRLSAEALGQNPDAPITQGALSAIRSDAVADGYAPLAKLGTIATDDAYTQSLQGLSQDAVSANRSFTGLAPKSPVDDVVKALNQPQFEASDGIAAMRYLRAQADTAFRTGNATDARAYKAAASTIEDMFERHLDSTGQADVLNNFRDARQLIAQTFTAGKALNAETGNFNALKYGQELARGKPLVDEQRTIANFATAFPKSARSLNESVPSVSPLDAYGSAMAAGAAHSAAPLLLPLTRVGIREYLLSSAGQARALPQAYKAADPTMGGLASLGVQVSNYLSN